MVLFNLLNVYLGFGDFLFLDYIELYIEFNEWVCLVGCNGVGKLMLMKVFVGEV